MVYRLVSTDGGTSYAASTTNSLLFFEQYGDRYSPETPTRDVFISGYLPRYQKTQLVGYFQDSGDLRSISVNQSGHVMTDIEVDVSSGLYVIVQSGVSVIGASQVSGAIQVSGIVGVSGKVSILSGHLAISSGEVHIMSGVTSVSGNVVSISGEITVQVLSGSLAILSGEVHVMSGYVTVASGLNVLIQSGVYPGTPTMIQVAGPTKCTAASGGEILVSGEVIGVIVKAPALNSGDIYIGGFCSNNYPYSGYGFILSPGDTVDVAINNIGKIRGCAIISGDLLAYMGNNYT